MKKVVKKSSKKTISNTKQQEHTVVSRQITAAILLCIAVFILIALFFDVTGVVGRTISSILRGFLGGCAFSIPVLLIYLTIGTISGTTKNEFKIKLYSGLAFIVSLSVILQLLSSFDIDSIRNVSDFFTKTYTDGTREVVSGGIIGSAIYLPLLKLFDKIGTAIIIGLITLISFMLLTGLTFLSFVKIIKRMFVVVGERVTSSDTEKEKVPTKPVTIKRNIDIEIDDMTKAINLPTADQIAEILKVDVPIEEIEKPKKESEPVVQVAKEIADSMKLVSTSYTFPPLSILNKIPSVPTEDISNELKNNSVRLIDTLKSFGISARVVNVSRGPSVTRYELAPGPGVKVSKISNLSDDIALSLAATGVRIEAPIPGKSAVGIEIPNKNVSLVPIREIITSREFTEAKGNLTVALGKDISGNYITADLGKMPHLLIAGSTGSGKSVCINSLIISLLYKSSPDHVKLLMIDPKVVELSVYNSIPHLLIPVVTDPKKAAGALNWAVVEMLNRYKLFAEQNVRDISGYNEAAARNEELEFMPQIVIIIDELADLMMAAPNEVEDSICRLAQMARAAGMHLVIATQRPSVDVLTGTIKANVPSRIAFAVASQINSRIILDINGAEKLLGKGDMLYSPIGVSKPVRVQGCFVTDREVEAVTKFISDEQDAEYDEKIITHIENTAIDTKAKGRDDDEPSDNDVMLPNAVGVILDAGLCSVSLLQRKLKLGYARAARIVDEMEELGYVGPYEGSKPRQVLVTRQTYQEMLMNKPN